MKRLTGFTLIELMVVVAVIVVLISLLLPAFARVHDIANEIKCKNNLKQLMAGMIAFAADHDEHLPGCIYDSGDPIPWHRDWMGDGSFGGSPQNGLLFPYVGREPSLYECPAMYEQAFNMGTWDTNGRFDYATFVVWSGAGLANIKPESIMYLPSGQGIHVPTPIIVQEDGNEINAGNDEDGHSNIDQITHIHRGGGFYACPDGHVEWIIEPTITCPGRQNFGAWDWDFINPTGALVTGGQNDFRWGDWNKGRLQ